MSGPKASDYSLERIRQEQIRRAQEAERRRIEAQRRAEEEARRKAEEERRRQEQIRKNANSIRTMMDEAAACVKRAGDEMNGQMVRMAAMGINVDNHIMDSLNSMLESLNNRFISPENAAQRGWSAVTECKTACIDIKRIAQGIYDQIEALERQINVRNANIVGNEGQQIRERAKIESKDRFNAERAKVLEKVTEIQRSLEKYSLNLPLEYINETMQRYEEHLNWVIESQGQHPAQQYEQLRNFHNQLEVDLKEKAGDWEELCNWQIRYSSLCEMLNQPIGNLPKDKKQLEALCSEASNRLEQREARLQVERALEECMAEMGYSLIGKRSDNGGTDSLYHMHGQTVLYVSKDASGRIAMEIGLGEVRQRTLQESEKEELVRDMNKFCTDYDTLKNKFAERGIEQRDVYRFPPGKELAHTINMSHFGVEQGTMEAIMQFGIDGSADYQSQAHLQQYINEGGM